MTPREWVAAFLASDDELREIQARQAMEQNREVVRLRNERDEARAELVAQAVRWTEHFDRAAAERRKVERDRDAALAELARLRRGGGTDG
ncbi:hypothetical protein [Actinomadura rugatobispora]|uniref:Uncharacterized protein n=1 Tax=Actinomadura rugatobispora TaxID=1994 RepID=A0ABW0ZV32_9ACTN